MLYFFCSPRLGARGGTAASLPPFLPRSPWRLPKLRAPAPPNSSTLRARSNIDLFISDPSAHSMPSSEGPVHSAGTTRPAAGCIMSQSPNPATPPPPCLPACLPACLLVHLPITVTALLARSQHQHQQQGTPAQQQRARRPCAGLGRQRPARPAAAAAAAGPGAAVAARGSAAAIPGLGEASADNLRVQS
ncbi:hypothetical protein GGTG_04507 [Gaeumannomyces tritici R3-111a-1]|uniref:Uncharacterized protein n=1 Tax=Gaeumannomyces tritici (strain R3-111a-1) TaxID=644352 RepID=J3NTA8_GAET3|nr:hypothetical protein GGTG_04507 [Gaeumannomyces tritici R3-111a-1]EJT79423.1 hypothetical protein GGTG_04507 [Gaeumannomyces tritici R3-111a-1]